MKTVYLALFLSLLPFPSLAQSDTLKSAYCARNWDTAEKIAFSQYQSQPIGSPLRQQWMEYWVRMTEYKLGFKQPNAEEWAAMNCTSNAVGINQATVTPREKVPTAKDDNVMVTQDGRVIDLSGLSGAESKIPVNYIPSPYSNDYSSSGRYSGSGNCVNPSDLDSIGRRCGRRSSSVRPGGR